MKKVVATIILVLLLINGSMVRAEIFNDGGVHTIDYQLDDNVWVEDSPSDDFTTINLVDGGIIRDWVAAMEHSHVNITGGSIGFDLYAEEYSQVVISGGSIAYGLYSFSESHVEIFGGMMGDELNVRDNSLIDIYGSGFMVDGIPVDYGPITTGTINELGMLTGTLTGTLQNNDLIDNFFYIDPDAAIFLVPEPSTMILFGIGSIIFSRIS